MRILDRLFCWLHDERPLVREFLIWGLSNNREHRLEAIEELKSIERVKTQACFWCVALCVAWFWAVGCFTVWLGTVVR